MKPNRGVEILAIAAVVMILAAIIGWLTWPSLAGADDEPGRLAGSSDSGKIWPV